MGLASIPIIVIAREGENGGVNSVMVDVNFKDMYILKVGL